MTPASARFSGMGNAHVRCHSVSVPAFLFSINLSMPRPQGQRLSKPQNNQSVQICLCGHPGQCAGAHAKAAAGRRTKKRGRAGGARHSVRAAVANPDVPVGRQRRAADCAPYPRFDQRSQTIEHIILPFQPRASQWVRDWAQVRGRVGLGEPASSREDSDNWDIDFQLLRHIHPKLN